LSLHRFLLYFCFFLFLSPSFFPYCREIGLDGLDGWTYSRARGAPPDTAPTPGAAAVEAGAVSAAAVAAAGAVTTPLTSKKGPRGARTKVVESDVLRTVHLPLQTNLTR